MKTRIVEADTRDGQNILCDMAFPLTLPVGSASGLSKREWFAGQLAAGLAANSEIELNNFSEIPEEAVKMADSLILELAKPIAPPAEAVETLPDSKECAVCGRVFYSPLYVAICATCQVNA